MTKKAELIKIANWKFRRIGKASKRVQIARDVLAQIKVNKFKPQHGTYFYTSQMLYVTRTSGKFLITREIE